MMGGGCIFSISPCQPLHAAWYPFDCPNIVSLILFSQHQSNSQAELSKPTREVFKVSKWKRTRNLSECISTYQSSLQCDCCIRNHLVTRPVTKGSASPPWKNFFPPEKMSVTYCSTMHNHCFRTCYRCKIWASLIKFFIPPGVPSWLRVCWWMLPCDFC